MNFLRFLIPAVLTSTISAVATAQQCPQHSFNLTNSNPFFRSEPQQLCVSNQSAKALSCGIEFMGEFVRHDYYLFDGDILVMLPAMQDPNKPLEASFMLTSVFDDKITAPLLTLDGPQVLITRDTLEISKGILGGGSCKVHSVSDVIRHLKTQFKQQKKKNKI